MPITYEIEDGGRFVHTRATGAITDQNLLTYQAALLSDTRIQPGFYELFDGTMAHGVEISEAVLAELGAMDKAAADKLIGGKCAIVVRRDFELAERFQRLYAGPHEVTVFYNLDVARTWLGLQGESE
jgi:hypothetical protein